MMCDVILGGLLGGGMKLPDTAAAQPVGRDSVQVKAAEDAQRRRLSGSGRAATVLTRAAKRPANEDGTAQATVLGG